MSALALNGQAVAVPFGGDAPSQSPWCQRWRRGLQAWRGLGEDARFVPDRYRVERVDFTTAAAFIRQHHYSGSVPAALRSYGLIDREADDGTQLVGAVMCSVPMNDRALTSVWPDLAPHEQSAELGRFVLLDEVPANAESWTLARAFRLAREDGLRGLVAFADPVRRVASDGRVVMPGHVGWAYQAMGGSVYLGRSTPRRLVILPDATVVPARALSKVRAQERGSGGVERRLVAAGARPRRRGEDPRAWLTEALNAAGARRITHGGNHRYAFALGTPADRRRARPGLAPGAYPKEVDAA